MLKCVKKEIPKRHLKGFLSGILYFCHAFEKKYYFFNTEIKYI